MSILARRNASSRASISASMVLKMRSMPSASLGDTISVTCGSDTIWAMVAPPMQKNVTRSGVYIVAAEHISAIKVVVLPRCLAPTTMMLLRSASTACTTCWDSSGMSITPTGNISPGF
ncbi:Uncharacterised protein [Mycobacterium tuberculosis]|nr:Uncharacterised protein [Mycobacterium tuberculosis]